jgi:hypothetical protein
MAYNISAASSVLMKIIIYFVLIISLSPVYAYGGDGVFNSCQIYLKQRVPGYGPSLGDALEVGLCLGMARAVYEMLVLRDSKTMHICLPSKELEPKDIAKMFVRRMEKQDLSKTSSTQAIISAFLAEYPCVK